MSDQTAEEIAEEIFAKAKRKPANGEKSKAHKGKRPAKDILIELAKEAELFHTPDNTPYADFFVNGHRETWPVRAKGFRRWLGRKYYEATHSAPNAEALQAALSVIEARAHYDAPECAIATRVAGLDGHIYLDLCNASWQAVEITEDGWRVVDEPPVRFRRANGMLPLPVPQRGGGVETLRKYLNLTETDAAYPADAKFTLACSVLLSFLRERGPYPVLVLAGEQGACKSTFAAVMRALVDPNASALRTLPRETRDLFIAASNGWVLCFDNVSSIPDWVSDSLCRLSTGGGFSTRALYTDDEETLFDAMRPIILNGIEDVVGRPDLADRAVFLTLAPIPEEKRRSELEFWVDFEKDKPGILGALLDRVAHGLKFLPTVRLKRTPRMADFARWGVACESTRGSFLAAYESNRQGAVEAVLESDVAATAVRAFMAKRTAPWEGTATDLLAALGADVGETITRAKEWPRTPWNLSGRLRRASTFLRKVGIEVCFPARSARSRTITITATGEAERGPNPASSASSASQDFCDGAPDDTQ